MNEKMHESRPVMVNPWRKNVKGTRKIEMLLYYILIYNK